MVPSVTNDTKCACEGDRGRVSHPVGGHTHKSYMGNMTSLFLQQAARLLGRQAGQGLPLFEVHLPFLRESIIVRDFQSD